MQPQLASVQDRGCDIEDLLCVYKMSRWPGEASEAEVDEGQLSLRFSLEDYFFVK